jgi:hypothetical protein
MTKHLNTSDIRTTTIHILDKLDELQETDYAQGNESFIEDIGDAIGALENALMELDKDEEQNRKK